MSSFIKNTLYTASVLLLLLLAGCSSDKEQAAPKDELVRSVNVETETLKPQKFERFLRLVGTVKSQNDVKISAEVAGRVERYFVSNGDMLKKGDPILKIDDAKLQRERARLEAQTEQTREQYERLNRVFKQDSIGSKIDVINAKANYEQSRAALQATNVDIKNTTVRAPFAGVLENRLIEEGEMASPGMPLVRLIGSIQLKVAAGVPSRYSDVVHKGDSVLVWFDFTSSDTLRLPVSFVGQSIDPDARTFAIEVKLPEKTQKYKVDMVANMEVRTLVKQQAIVIGQEYLYQKGDGYVAYVAGKNEQGETVAIERGVQTGPAYKNNIVIEKGLTAGDRLITIGSSYMQNNMRITLVDEKGNGIAQSR